MSDITVTNWFGNVASTRKLWWMPTRCRISSISCGIPINILRRFAP